MKKTILLYGLALAVLAFILNVIEYKFLVRDLSVEFYITVVAVLFTATGIWVGKKITSPKKTSEEFQRNTRALEYLEITERELEVLELVARGLSNKQIAAVLYVSVNTVKTHLSRLYSKMEVNRRTEAVEKAKSLKLIP